MDRNLEEQLNLVKNETEFEEWLAECNRSIRLLERCLKSRITVGESQRLISILAQTKCLRLRAQRSRYVRRGAGYASTSVDQPSTSRRTTVAENVVLRRQLVWENIESAFISRMRTGAIVNFDHLDPREFLHDARQLAISNVQEILRNYPTLKVNCVLNAEYINKDKKEVKAFNTKNSVVPLPFELEEWYENNFTTPILKQMEEFQERDSGWALSRILYLLVNINQFSPMTAGCRMKLPKWIEKKHAVVNVKSNDQACFAWSVLAALEPATENVTCPSSYRDYKVALNTSRITFPMDLKNIKAFEEDNHVLINIFIISGENMIAPLKLTKYRANQQYINLLLIEDKETNHFHFAWIKNLSRLTSSQLSKHRGKKHICNRLALKKKKTYEQLIYYIKFVSDVLITSERNNV